MLKKLLLFILIASSGIASSCLDWYRYAKCCCFRSNKAARPASLLITGEDPAHKALYLKYITVAAHDHARRSPTLWQHIKEHACFWQKKPAKKTN